MNATNAIRALLTFSLAALAPLAGCASSDDAKKASNQEATGEATDDATSAASPSYFVVRNDTRACSAPACGGYYVARANKPTTRCADGVYAAECYVASLDLTAAKLSAKRKTDVVGAIGEGRVIALGSIAKTSIGKKAYGVFDASGAYLAPIATPLAPPIHDLFADAMACNDAACGALRESDLNTTAGRAIVTIDMSAAPGSDTQQNDALVEAYSPAGLLGIGTNAGTSSKNRVFAPSNYFLRVAAGETLCGADLGDAIAVTTASMTWMSESDYPIAYFERDGEGGSPLTASRLLTLAGLDATTVVDERTLAVFSGPGRNDADMAPDERALAVRYRALRHVLEANLTGIHVYYTGHVQLGVYVVGATRCGELAGITTTAIETLPVTDTLDAIAMTARTHDQRP